jgi:NitT/TauT family transport system substrate-binding protein
MARLTTLALIALVTFGLCCLAQGQATPSAAKPAASNAPKQVRLGYFANVTHAQAVLGVDSGEFARAVAPANFTTKTFNAGPSLIEALFAGEIDIGYVGPSPAANAFLQSRGKGLRVIAGAAADGVVIVVRPGSGIEKLEDLKGKRIATPQLGNTQDISARHYLMKVLGQTNAENVIPVPNAEQASMMARGQIDAAWAVEPWGARLVSEAGAKIIGQEKDLWPEKTFTLTLVVVTPEFLEKYPDTVRQILSVHRDWTARLSKEPAKHVPTLAAALEKLTGKKLPEELIASAISRVRFTDEPLPQSIRTFAQWAVDLGMARGVPDVSAMVDTSMLEQLRAQDTTKPADATPNKKP